MSEILSEALSETKHLVRDQSGLAEVVASLSTASEVAIDCEFQGEGHYRPMLCLVQLGWKGHVAAVDGIGLDLTELAPVLMSRELRKVFHDGRQDLPILQRATGATELNNIFDTRIGAGFLGYPPNGGLGALVKEICGVELDKSLQTSDWSAALSDAQIEYALNDVRYLGIISESVRSRLLEKGRLAWAQNACDVLVEKALHSNSSEKMFRKIGGPKMGAKPAGVLRALVEWRESEAEKIDKPVNFVASEIALKQLAFEQPLTRDALTKIRGLGAGKNQAPATRLLAAIQQGLANPGSEPVPMSFGRDQRIEGAVGALNLVRRIIADREELAADLLAESDDIRDLVEWYLEGRPAGVTVELLEGWQKLLVGEVFLEVLAGKQSLLVDPQSPSGLVLRPV